MAAICLAVCLALMPASSCLAAGRDDWQQPDRVIQDLNLKSGAQVADVGCGTGYFTFRIAKAIGADGRVLAVDIDEKALDSVRKQAEQEKLTNVVTMRSDPTDTKLAPESVDVSLLCIVLHHVPEAQRQPLVESVAKGLKPGGYLYVIDYKAIPPGQGNEEMVPRGDAVKLAETAKLTLDAEWYYLSYEYFLRFRKPVGQ